MPTSAVKVLLVYYEPMPSGQTTHVLSLASGLDRREYRLTVVLPSHLSRSAAAFRSVGVEVIPLSLHKLIWAPQAVVALASLIRRRDPDIVHVHSQEAGLLGRLVGWIAGARKVVYTPQVIDIRRARWHWLYVQIERTLARITTTIISVNEVDRERMIRLGIPATKIVTIPNGIDPGGLQGPGGVGHLRRSLGLDEHRPVVMQVGRMSAQKDPLAFVEGAALVARKCPDAQFVLVGEGPLRQAVATRIQALGLSECVHLPGWQEEASRLVAAADVVGLTSRWEGLPYAVLEAMAMSRPVVVTGTGGCPEVVVDGSTGFLVPVGDVGMWARRVIELLDDPAMGEVMGRRGRRRVEERFSLREMVARTDQLYQQVAGVRQ